MRQRNNRNADTRNNNQKAKNVRNFYNSTKEKDAIYNESVKQEEDTEGDKSNSDDGSDENFNSDDDPDELDMYSTTSKERRRKKVRARLPLRKRLGASLESSDIQVVIVVLVLLDVVIALVRLFTKLGAIPYLSKADSINQFLEYGSVFITMIFLLELIFAFLAFGLRTFSHPGYVVDFGVVGAQVFLSASYESLAVRLLGIGRFWRLIRLIRDFIAQIEESHQETLQLLEEQRDRNDDLVAQLRGKNDDLRREVDRRSRVQEMLKSYKEEVETLQEALFIAAQTTASDAASLLPPETIDSLTSQFTSNNTNRNDVNNIPLGTNSNFDNSYGADHLQQPKNFVVEEDGSVRTV